MSISKRAAKIACVDSHALIWGVRKQGSPAELESAEALFELLDEERAQVILPTIVLAEFLTPVEEKHHAEITEQLNKRFLIKPFDIRCASLAAILFMRGKKLVTTHSGWRSVLRADTMIIATAACHGARVFYSHDKDCRQLASTVPTIEARDLPTHSVKLPFGKKP